MIYTECPNEYVVGSELSLFLAGGITNCEDWQSKMVNLLKDTDYHILNPRRTSFNITDPDESVKQINWEFNHLNRANMILFWFPCETLCPITLYELGYRCRSDDFIFIGVHPEYKRKIDVEVQIKLIRPDIKIVYSLEDLAQQLIDFEKYNETYRRYG